LILLLCPLASDIPLPATNKSTRKLFVVVAVTVRRDSVNQLSREQVVGRRQESKELELEKV